MELEAKVACENKDGDIFFFNRCLDMKTNELSLSRAASSPFGNSDGLLF